MSDGDNNVWEEGEEVSGSWWYFYKFSRVVWEALKDKTTFEERSVGSDEVNHAEIPEAGACFQFKGTYSRHQSS